MRCIISFLLILTTLAVNARQVTPEEAQSIASEFFNSDSTSKVAKTPRRVTQASRSIERQSEPQPYYIFNATDNAGFVIISGDTRAKKILGYSDHGNFDTTDMPPQLIWLLGEYKKQIATLSSSTSEDESWINNEKPNSTDGVLLETVNWGQDYPFNAKCPLINGVQAPAGCVATAMAIVMKYHNWPNEAFGSNIYLPTLGTGIDDYLSYEFIGQIYEWESMLDDYSKPYSQQSVDNVASLMSAAGHSVDMDYGMYESGAYIWKVGHALRYHFKFDESCEFAHKSNYSDEEWNSMLRSEIDSNRPVIYQGDGIGNHAFVCDGYNDNTFHFNWGWNGTYNGYYALSALNPDIYDFSSDASMILGITPDVNWKESSQAYVDPGYLPGDSGTSKGASISVEKVEVGVPFDFKCEKFTIPSGFSGKVGVALTDKDGNIKEILGQRTCQKSRLDTRQHDVANFKNIKCTEYPEASDYIQVVTKRPSDSSWLIVKGTTSAPSKVSVIGKAKKMVDIEIVNEFPFGRFRIDGETLEPGKYNIPEGSVLSFSCSMKSMVDKGYDGYRSFVVQNHNGEDIIYCGEKSGDYSVSGSVTLTDGEYLFRLYSTTPESKHIDMSGSRLESQISPVEALSISQLSMSGIIDANDLSYIQETFKYLNSLNLSEASIGECLRNDVHYEENTIPANALRGLYNLESVNLPGSLEKIGDYSFAECNLYAVNIPHSVTSVGEVIFGYNYNLTEVMVHWIEPHVGLDVPNMFFLCPIFDNGSLYVPNNTKDVYRDSENWGLFPNIIEQESFPENPIDYAVIEGVNYLLNCLKATAKIIGFTDALSEHVIIPTNIDVDNNSYQITEIAKNAFSESKLKFLGMPSSIVTLGENCFSLSELKEVVLSPSLKVIPKGCFSNCYDLEKADLPEGIEFIGWNAFGTAKSLKSLHLPSKVLLSSEGSFSSLSNCTSISVDPENPYYKTENNTVYTKDGKGIILIASTYEGEYLVPEYVTALPWNMFCHMPKLTGIDMPHHISTVPYMFVNSCPLLKHVTLPDNAISTNTETISECESLKSITIGRKMEHAEGIHNNPKLEFIYLRNENVLNIPLLFQRTKYDQYSFYTDRIYKNVILDDCKAFYVPGACRYKFSGIDSEKVKEMWDFAIDRTKGILMIKPLYDEIKIDDVKINGTTINPSNRFYYASNVDNYDVEVNFTIHGHQNMTTLYDSEFCSSIIDSQINEDEAGIDSNFWDGNDTVVKIYDIQGTLIYKGKYSDAKLDKGLYIIKMGDKTFKHMIK